MRQRVDCDVVCLGMDRIVGERGDNRPEALNVERSNSSSDAIANVVAQPLALGMLEHEIGECRRFARPKRQLKRDAAQENPLARAYSFRPFRYSRNSLPRSYRFSANSTVAFKNPSLSPAS